MTSYLSKASRTAAVTSPRGTRHRGSPGFSHNPSTHTYGSSPTVQPINAVESPEADPSNANTTFPVTSRPGSARFSKAPNGNHESVPFTHWPRRNCRKTGSRIVLRTASNASSAKNGSSHARAGFAIFQASRSSISQPSGAAYSFKKKAGSSPSRPCLTNRHKTESSESAGVLITNVKDSGRLPAADVTASHTGSVT